ncbi:MAG: hypothetical protein HY981_04080 [Candidatus Magasanikbacteria bacterium]|nr:hypothetical protein [Candidatus Magasanikbacteria bacterium]
MNHIKFFKDISKKNVDIAGGKGASLGEMTRAGIPVPPGFVITASAFDRFVKETELGAEIDSLVHELNYHDIARVEFASERIRDLIHDAKTPKDLETEITKAFKQLKAKLVAVRSSATAEDLSQASWAGELESYLNTTSKTLLDNVKQCWSSLFTPRALVYRNEKGMHKSYVSVAVVVQKMVESKVAGVSFTVHPVTKDKHQMIIEAAWGLGEALVGGIVTPDSYVLDKRDWSLIDVNVSEQSKMIVRNGASGTVERAVPVKIKHHQKITGKQITEIAKLCARIEKHYGFPCDIEWAYEKKKFYIVQSRPITTL